MECVPSVLCSSLSLFTAFSYAYHIFWYSTLSPLLSYVCSYTSLHLCVCVFSNFRINRNLSGELVKTHIAGTNFRVFILKVGDKSWESVYFNKFQDNISRTSFLESILCIFNLSQFTIKWWPHEHYKKLKSKKSILSFTPLLLLTCVLLHECWNSII